MTYKISVYLIFLIFCFNNSPCPAQKQKFSDISKSYISPLDIEIRLAGSFAEPRTNHFHSGLDMKTQQKTGLKVYAVADGYISRIAVSPFGYGKVLYITHPGGYTSVYGHLEKFNSKINNYIKDKQYQQKSFSINIDTLSPKTFPVKQGDIIAYTGNSGSSGGPHLHFEIRETESECPIIPIYDALSIKDKTPPVINTIQIYPSGNATKINGNNKKTSFTVKESNGNLIINDNSPINISGCFYLGINCFDRADLEPNKNGIAGFNIYIDEKQAFKFEIDKFSFDESKCINAVKDYPTFINSGINYYTSLIQSNNPLQFYNTEYEKGIFCLESPGTHKIKITVYDNFKNESNLTFTILTTPIITPSITPPQQEGVLFKWNNKNTLEKDGFTIFADKAAFFDDQYFKIDKQQKRPANLSPIYITDATIALKTPVKIQISTKNIDKNLLNKTFIVRLGKNDNPIYLGGNFDNETICINTSQLGKFTLMCDTIAPKITPLNINENKNLSGQNTIKITLSDNLSGIDANSIEPSLNGKWILTDWDPKTKTLTYNFDDKLTKGHNLLEIKIKDNASNNSYMKMNLLYK